MLSTLVSSPPFQTQTGDRIVSKVLSAAISALFKRTEKLEVNVRAEPVAKLLQGSVDSAELIGKGMLMYNGLRLEAMELYFQAVSIDFSAVFLGQIKLRQPARSSMRVVLTEADLTTSFNTSFVVSKLQWLHYEGNSLNFQNTVVTLGEDNSLRLQSQITLGTSGQVVDIDLRTQVEIEDQRKIQFVSAQCQGDELAVNLGRALIDHVNDLLNLDKFALDGTQLRINRLRIQNKQIVFYGSAQVDWFPSLKR